MINILFSFDQKKVKQDDGTFKEILSSLDFVIYNTDTKEVTKYYYDNENRSKLLDALREVKSHIANADKVETQVITFAFTSKWYEILTVVCNFDNEALTNTRCVNMLPIVEFLDVNPIANKFEKLNAKCKRIFKDDTITSDTPTIVVMEKMLSHIKKMKSWMGQKGYLLG